MRNELTQIERIEKYLRNELSADEKKVFETELKTNAQLQEQVKLQKQVLDGLNILALKTQAKNAYSKFKWGKNLKKWGGIGGTAIVISAATFFAWDYVTTDKNGNANAYELPQFNENDDTLWADADKYLPYQKFTINTSADTVIETEDGIVMAIPAGAFLDENGNQVKGNIELEVKEAIHPNDILKSGLSTKSGNNLLETGGMFYINARSEGKSLKIDPAKGIYTEVPTNEIKPGMQLFEGKRLANGQIDWVNPKPLEKFLVPVDIHSLNFYPPNYEDSLAGMSKDAKNKIYKDSLYYSFASLFGDDKTLWNPVNMMDSVPRKDSSSHTNNLLNVSNVKKYNNDYYIKTKPLGIHFRIENGELCGEKNCENEREAGKVIQYLKEHNFQYSIAMNNGKHNIAVYRGEIKKVFALDGEVLFKKNCAMCHNPTRTMVGPALKGAKQRWADAGISEMMYSWIRNPKRTLDQSQPYVKNLVNMYNMMSIPLMTAQKVNKEEIDAIFNYIETFQDGINPAKIKAIWDSKFNNTILATREFEERLKYIHQTCNSNVLDIYVNNLDKKLCTLDSMAAHAAGAHYDKFMEFAARGDGRIKSGQKHLEKLRKYYENKTKAYTQALEKTEKEFWAKQNKKAGEFELATAKQNDKERKRLANNYQKEWDANLSEAQRQLGLPEKTIANPTIVAPVRFAVNVVNTGWKNIDALVTEATTNRTTLDYTDLTTGKRAVIEYKELSVSISDAKQYESVFVYVIPDKLDSYMRLEEKEGRYTEKLNGTFSHEMVCVGYKNNQTYFHYVNGISAGEYSNITLQPISAQELDKRLSSIKQYKHKAAMTEELAYHYLEQKENIRKKKVKDLIEFRNRIKEVIFPCGLEKPGTVMADSTSVAANK